MSAADLSNLPAAPATTSQLSPAAEKMVHDGAEQCTKLEIPSPNLTPPLNPEPQSPNPEPALSPQQLTALNLLMMGKPVAIVAYTLGVHRNTVTRWKTQDPRFIAELNRRRQDVLDTAAAKLRRLLIIAANELELGLDRDRSGETTKTAFRFLSATGAMSLAAEPAGPTDPDEILEQLRNPKLPDGTPIEHVRSLIRQMFLGKQPNV